MRTGVSTAFKLLGLVCKVLANHRTSILGIVGEDKAAALDNLVIACHVFTDILAPFIHGV